MPSKGDETIKATRTSPATSLRWVSVAILLLAAVLPATSLAQDGGAFRTDDGLRGNAVALVAPGPTQSWAPVQIEITNDGTSMRSLEVSVQSGMNDGPQRIVTWALDLAGRSTDSATTGATKIQILPVFVGHDAYSEVNVSIRENGTEIAVIDRLEFRRRQLSGGGQRRSILYRDINAFFVTTEESKRDAESVRQEYTASFARSNYDLESPAAPILARHLPIAAEAYEAVDRIVLIGVEPSDLSAPQRRALRTAIRSGRVAWIVPGPQGEGAGWVLDPSRHKIVSSTIEVAGGASGAASAWDCFKVENDPGRPSVERGLSDGSVQPMVRIYADGLGSWKRIVARQLTTIPFEPTFEQRVVGVTAATITANAYRQRSSGELGWVEDVDSTHRAEVPILLVFGLIVTYLLGIGPILFWLLKRKGKLIWLLWIQPAVVIGFLIGTYVIGYLHFGAFVASYQTLVVNQPLIDVNEDTLREHETWGYGYSLLTRYNPREGSFSLRCADGSLPMFRAVAQRDPDLKWRFDNDSPRLDSVELPEWSYSHFMSSGPLKVGGAVRVQLNIVPVTDAREERQHQITIKNDLPFAVSNPTFKLGERLVRIQREILPGETVVMTEESITRAVFATDISRRLFDAQSHGRTQLVVEFDPTGIPSPGIPFAVETDYETQTAYLVVVEQ